MTTQKIVSGNGFNEGGAVINTTGTGEYSTLPNDAIERTAVPADERRYGVVEYVAISAGAATQELCPAVSGRQIEVLSYVFICDDASAVTFKSGTTAISGAFAMATYGGVSSPTGTEEALMITAVDEALNITNSNGNIAAHVTYRIVKWRLISQVAFLILITKRSCYSQEPLS